MTSPRGPASDGSDHNIGDLIRTRRLLLGMSMAQLGDAVGVSSQQMQKYEIGKNRISASRLQQIAVALKMPVSHFYDLAKGADGIQVLDGVSGRYGEDPARRVQRLRLMQAFECIEDPLVQKRFIELVECLSSRAQPN